MFWTGVSAFLVVFLPTATGWITKVQTSGHLADPSVLRSAGVSALAAAGAAIITAGTVALRQQSWFPGIAPIYPPANTPQGTDAPPE
jgi:hypothetical protein